MSTKRVTMGLYDSIGQHIFYTLGKRVDTASTYDFYTALCYAVKDRMMELHLKQLDKSENTKQVAYLSAEFLIGPQLGNNIVNLGIQDEAIEALADYDLSLEDVLSKSEEPGLGNGGLGRLAACYMESLSTLDVPAIGYGIRYKFGMFKQLIKDNQQYEVTDNWLHGGWPWELAYPADTRAVGFGGRVEHYTSSTDGSYKSRWVPDHFVDGVPYDVLQVGYRNGGCNKLRLWRADAKDIFDFYAFNIGDYLGSVEQSVHSETISKVLYPNDGTDSGRQLRLKQQFFFVSCSIQDMLGSLTKRGIPINEFADYYTLQLNDTHPSIAVAELMRLFVDEHQLDWDTAWEITHKSIAYTNHTLLPEALEKWEVRMFEELLPRHLEIIYEINERFLQVVRLKYPGDDEMLSRLSIICEKGNKSVRMAHLATVGSHHVNGVAVLHSELVKSQLMPEFYDLWPHKFENVTNGVTPRRWLKSCNQPLSEVLDNAVGPDWVTNMDSLRKLEDLQDDSNVLEQIAETKLIGKHKLASYINKHLGVVVDPSSMFDVHVKRIHEYKRQHLKALEVIIQYLRIKNGGSYVPRTVVFGGKAAPGYYMAKEIVHFINCLAETINSDPDMDGKLKVVFLPNYNVKLGELVYPAADLSEQISTAGKEASGTGNMKFQMNGALTIGTLDGANVEIRDLVGEENFFLFGKNEEEIGQLQSNGYNPKNFLTDEIEEALNLIRVGHFSHGDHHSFWELLNNLINHDPFFVLADLEHYVSVQDTVSDNWIDKENWYKKSLTNIARSGFFSSDRSIKDYCQKIWNIDC